MNIVFPKGFFETLSEKCQKEIKEKAEAFKSTVYFNNVHLYQDRYNNNPLGLPPDQYNTPYGMMRLNNIQRAGTVTKADVVGIHIDQYGIDAKQAEFKKLFDLEKEVEEYIKLKNSIANIKDLIK
jgi:hypothetical protein